MDKFNRLAMRKPRKKALICIARKLLVVIWNVLKYEKAYNPALVPVYDPVKMKSRIAYLKKEYEKSYLFVFTLLAAGCYIVQPQHRAE